MNPPGVRGPGRRRYERCCSSGKTRRCAGRRLENEGLTNNETAGRPTPRRTVAWKLETIRIIWSEITAMNHTHALPPLDGEARRITRSATASRRLKVGAAVRKSFDAVGEPPLGPPLLLLLDWDYRRRAGMIRPC